MFSSGYDHAISDSVRCRTKNGKIYAARLRGGIPTDSVFTRIHFFMDEWRHFAAKNIIYRQRDGPDSGSVK